MTADPRETCQQGPRSFRDCFVDGDSNQLALERSVRRRALLLSLLMQTAALTALLIVPLFGKLPQITAREVVPIPPYYHPSGPRRGHMRPRTRPQRAHCVFCAPNRIPSQTPILPPETGVSEPSSDQELDLGTGPPGPRGPGNIPLFDNRPPSRPVKPPVQPRRVRIGTLKPAMLIHRVEPVYPTLMRQIGRSGRVELHAIISTDGTIESLQVVSGDPGFYQSALEAVRQWRYKPTILNGQAVEVETNITVIYVAH